MLHHMNTSLCNMNRKLRHVMADVDLNRLSSCFAHPVLNITVEGFIADVIGDLVTAWRLATYNVGLRNSLVV